MVDVEGRASTSSILDELSRVSVSDQGCMVALPLLCHCCTRRLTLPAVSVLR